MAGCDPPRGEGVKHSNGRDASDPLLLPSPSPPPTAPFTMRAVVTGGGAHGDSLCAVQERRNGYPVSVPGKR